jgi:hypothetical protein
MAACYGNQNGWPFIARFLESTEAAGKKLAMKGKKEKL